MELNPSQLRAVSFGSGPCLVLAGPGSGKTTVIIRRLHNLISEYHVLPEHVLAVTFSRAAAQEMAQRFAGTPAARMNVGSPGVTFGTVHSIFLKIIREEYRAMVSIINPAQGISFIRHELDRYSVPCKNVDSMCNELLLSISRLKSAGSDDCIPFLKSGLPVSDSTFLRIFSDYSLFLRERGLLDFDDLINETSRLFRQDPDVLSKWQDRFRFLNIDEFQDLSPIQYSTLMLLAGPSANVFAVGDDDQSIYGFRGAGRNVMRRFIRDNPQAEQIILDINYRCPSDIIDASVSVICENRDRFDKNPRPFKNGGIVTFTSFTSCEMEYSITISKLFELISAGKTCAVLFRSEYDYSIFVIMLKKAGLPFKCKVKRASVSDRSSVRDVLSYIRTAAYLAAGSSSSCRNDILIIANRPERYISRDALTGALTGSASSCFQSMTSFYRNDPVMMNAVDRLKRDLLMISSLSPFAAVRYVRKALGYDKWLLNNAESKGQDPNECMEDLDRLEGFASECSSLDELISATYDDLTESSSEETAKISVMTMHASKGLEFDAVFLPDVNEGIIPCKSAIEEGTIDEERRLLYVAMTRAKEELHISYVNEYRYKPAEASRLIRNLV